MTTNAIYEKQGTSITFTESGGDVVFTLDETVIAANGQVSAEWDRGAGASRPALYKWDLYIKYIAAPTLGDVVRLYLYDAEVTAKCDVTTGDVTPETKLGNFKLVGQSIASVAADQTFYATGLVAIFGRFVTLAVWNAGAQTLEDGANASYVVLTPFYPDVQAAA